MGIGTSTFLIALGAVLKFAVTATVSGISLATVGVILMLAGILGLVVTLLVSQRGPVDAVVTREPVVTRERVVERDPLL